MEQIKIEESEILDAYCEKRICKDLPNVNCTASSSNEYVKQELDNQYHSHDDASSLNPENEECDNKCVIKKLIDQKEIKVENEETECIIHNVEYLTTMDLVKKEKEELLFQECMDETADHIIDGNKCLIRQYIPENSNQNCMIPSEDSLSGIIKIEPEEYEISADEVKETADANNTSSEDKYYLQQKNKKCSSCNYSTSDKANLNVYIESHHLDLNKHQCLNNSVHLNLRNHKCQLCGYSATKLNYLQRHVEGVHLLRKNHECDQCDYSATDDYKLNLHNASMHRNARNHKCPKCDYTSFRKFLVNRHIASVHLELKKHKCHLCSYSTPKKSRLKQHFNRTHLNLIGYQCHLCDYSANVPSRLQRHVDSVHLGLKNHKCIFCDYSASQKSSLKRHLDKVHLRTLM